VYLIEYIGTNTELVLPDKYNDKNYGINNYAFYGCSSLTEISIPDNVTSIGGDAFTGCTGLISITIPDSVTSIGDSAFLGCSNLTSVVIGNGVTFIGRFAFYCCNSLTSVTFENTNGWGYSTHSDGTNGTGIPSSSLSNTELAASLLNYRNCYYYWKRT
jgi:hypothetical protein